jgi:hypothetical protein
MNHRIWIVSLFAIAALYDALLGLLFLAAPGYPFERFGVVPPNHWGYVQFPAALLLIFALMFAAIARDPVRNRGLMIYGVLLKAAYCGVASWHWMTAGIPWMWQPFVIVDAVMGVLFILAYIAVGKRGGTGGPS